MRLTAEEARQNADLKTNGEAILNCIFTLVKKYSDFGLKEFAISSNSETENYPYTIIKELFNNKDKYEYVTEVLISLGYKITRYNKDLLRINWE